ncbi:MAG: ABC transporter substrate-binding protein [Deltaproteobacteria bacterium]|nr:ABC transporter substrate-binding protein [Deltaproteobacteria bacterium]MBM4298964.1 ABC transporter substrate-binding protein [Deltaproteobacteria bacterium]
MNHLCRKYASELLGVVAILLLCAGSASSQSLQKVVTGWSSPSGNQAVVWVAKDGGYFQQQGLDVELVFVGAGSKMIQALLAGDIKIAQVGGAAPLSARLAGADIKIVAVSFNTLALSVMAHKDIRTMADLKGKRIGVSRYGSNTDFGIRYLLRKHGLVPDKDVAILQLGDAIASFAGLQAGTVQASIISYPTISLAKRAGFREIADIASDASFEYPGSSIVVTERTLLSQADLVRRFLAAYVQAIGRFKSDEPFTKQVIAQRLRIHDAAIVDESYRYAAQRLPKMPYPTANGMRMGLESLGSDPRVKSIRAEDFYDDTILRGLERDGVLKQLYR